MDGKVCLKLNKFSKSSMKNDAPIPTIDTVGFFLFAWHSVPHSVKTKNNDVV